ncbi:hypothetical protein [Klebsiella pneumoniae IS43]|uniref:Uncharacterized protein n=1 Tax=Klebsiella pneumoniae IS43 TaxID=1432552 RepID=W1DDR3_KLEPN|nr:hypothetical protein [Escherichia coli]CDL07558.1 hypothetical protein [Klebsiella pneumoniae IS43]
MKNVWYNKNIINKIECCSVDNLQSLLRKVRISRSFLPKLTR